jgi:hypothetical protein
VTYLDWADDAEEQLTQHYSRAVLVGGRHARRAEISAQKLQPCKCPCGKTWLNKAQDKCHWCLCWREANGVVYQHLRGIGHGE